MFRTWSLSLLAAVAVLGASVAWADVAPGNGPPPNLPPNPGIPGVTLIPPVPGPAVPAPGGKQIPLVVRIDPNAAVSRLILPPEAAGEEDLAPGDEAPPATAPAPRAPAPEGPQGAFFQSPTRSILAGLCLSLAIGAVFFIPRTGGVAQMLLIGVVGLGAIGMTAATFADIPPGPPFNPQPLPPRPRPQPPAGMVNLVNGRVEVEWTGRRGAPVTLIIAGRNVQLGGGGGGVGAIPLPPPVPAPVTRSPESAPERAPPRAVER